MIHVSEGTIRADFSPPIDSPSARLRVWAAGGKPSCNVPSVGHIARQRWCAGAGHLADRVTPVFHRYIIVAPSVPVGFHRGVITALTWYITLEAPPGPIPAHIAAWWQQHWHKWRRLAGDEPREFKALSCASLPTCATLFGQVPAAVPFKQS